MIYGVTIDDISDPKAVVDAYFNLPSAHRQARIVIDQGVPLALYDHFRARIPEPVVWLPVDSSETESLSHMRFHERVMSVSHLSRSGDVIDINEVNGDWTGDPSVSAEKAADAIDVIHATRRESLLTLYQEGPDLQPLYQWLHLHWSPKDGRPTPTHVGISYYPRQSDDGDPDFEQLFGLLALWFPRSRLRWSELGSEKFDEKNRPVPPSAEEVLTLLANYYGKPINQPKFDGGYYWWSFVKQMVKGPFLKDLLARCEITGSFA